jgi:hypothetical protein
MRRSAGEVDANNDRLPARTDPRSSIVGCSTKGDAARDRNRPIKTHQINLQRSLIGSEYQPIRGRGQPFRVCGRDRRCNDHPLFLS